MTRSVESSMAHLRRGHRSGPSIAAAGRKPDGTGGAASRCRSDVDLRFQRVAHLAANVDDLSELTQTMILSRVEAEKRQNVDHRQSGEANDSGTTPAATPQAESVSPASELRSAPERMKRIEHLLKAIHRAYGALNKFMATGSSTDQADTYRESTR